MQNSLMLFLAAFLVSCDGNLCGNKLIEDVTSPNGKYTASIFERNCGATTPYVRIVNLHSSGAKFDPDNDDDWVFTIHGQSNVKASWISGDELRVYYSATGDQPTRREKWRDIVISYE